MVNNLDKKFLIDFEIEIKNLWDQARIPYYIHLSGGNEKELLDIFREIHSHDFVISTHRSHYHYLLKGGNPEKLKGKILRGESMHICDSSLNFLSTAIVAGGPPIAAGLALGIKLKKEKRHVWCFVGDGAEDEGTFYEAVRYVDGHNLPCIFIIEDNNRSVETPKNQRYGTSEMIWPKCVRRYNYIPTYPHAGTGKFVDFSGTKLGNTM